MKTFFSLILIGLGVIAHAQTAEEIVHQATQHEELTKLGNQLKIEQERSYARALELAKKYNWPLEYELPDGGYAQLVGVDALDQPLYNVSDNRTSARTISTDKVHNGGGAGYNLEGQGMIVGEWDGGAVRRTHQEFGNRVVQRDNATSISSHATHVGGTMIASGVRSTAKGMAPRATLWAHDWSNDSYEMTQEAKNSSFLVSCHSYGTAAGFAYRSGRWYWYGNPSLSQTEDYKFGFYNSKARDWDQIARLAPYYLICKSAGNDRNDYTSGSHRVYSGGRWITSTTKRKRDGDYNSITYNGNAKNILTIGAVEDISAGYSTPSSVRMSSFSCWGPTDDGRIKPDIVANGTGMYSTESASNSSYGSKSGTSMATPSVAGSLILLQQHSKNLNNRYLKSATLKALVLHTADEAGRYQGPDYTYGWGLMNTRKAADVLANKLIDKEENTLTNRGTYTKTVRTSGKTPIKITICWTDYEGTPTSIQLNPKTLMLRNDLDVRLVHQNGSPTYMPYVLNPSVPAAAATRGDNVRDNVEQIYIQAPAAGTYTIRVTHKGNLVGGKQDFSLIAEGFVEGPTARFTRTASTVCKGDTVFYTNNSLGAFNSTQWRFTGGHISNSSVNKPFVVYNTTGTFLAELTVSNNGISDKVSASVTVRELPIPKITNDTTFCLPLIGKRRIYATPVGGKWNGKPWMTRQDSCVFFPFQAGVGNHKLKYSVTDAFGCKGVDSTFIDIKQSPTVNFNNPKTLTCPKEAPFALSGGTPTGGKYWIAGNTIDSIFPANYPLGYVNIKYVYTDPNSGCSSEARSFVNIDICESTDEINNQNVVNIYPNPFSNKLVVKATSEIKSLEIIDSKGAIVYKNNQTESFTIELPTEKLESGVYSIKINTAGTTSVKRIIKK